MYAMFSGASSFNQPLLNWNVAGVVDISEMFLEAYAFNQSLCDWGPKLDPNAEVQMAFWNTSCLTETDPDLESDPRGPFCREC